MSPSAADSERPTVLGLQFETVGKLFKRSILGSVLTLFGSLIALLFYVLSVVDDPLGDGPTPEIQLSLFSFGALLVVLFFLSLSGIALSLLAYGGWGYWKHRLLRAEMESPERPSPFRSPRRLLGILTADGDTLTDYERCVQATGMAILVGLFVLVVVLDLLGIVTIPLEPAFSS